MSTDEPTLRELDEPRGRIIRAARGHFLLHGFRAVTMDELASSLGMSKKTLYSHFPSKSDLLLAVLHAKLDEIDSELAELTSRSTGDFPAMLSSVMACMHRHTEELQPAFVRDMQRAATELFSIVEVRRQQIIEKYFGKILADGRKTGVVRKDVPVKLLISILLATVHGLMNPQRIRELGITPRIGYSTVMDLFLHGALVREDK